MNSRFVKQQAEALARRVESETAPDAADSTRPEPDSLDVQRIERMYQLAFGRSPTSDEQQTLLDFLQQFRARRSGKSDDSLVALSRVVLTSNEFFFVD